MTRPRPVRRRLLAALVTASVLPPGAVLAAGRPAHAARERDAPPRPFAFALLGDAPYNPLEARMLERVFEAFDRDLAFAIHVGDLKAATEPCDDALLEARRALLDTSPLPLVFVPGDNEWTDCGRTRAGRFDPLERLDRLRRRFYMPARLLGAHGASGTTLRLTSQADEHPGGLPENLRWGHEQVRFVTLNLPGSDNGRSAAGIGRAAHRERAQANARWLRESYVLAEREGDRAVVVVGHANPRFDRDQRAAARRRTDPANASDANTDDTGPDSGASIVAVARRGDAYAPFRALLRELSDAFPGPTLFLHGDTHHHRIEPVTAKLLRVESYGSPFADRWLRIDIHAGAANPFAITRRRSESAAQTP